MKPVSDIDGARRAQERLHSAIAPLSDADMRRDSLLPGWSIGHVLTHLARNAESHAHMLAGAGRGEIVLQYPGGVAQREGDIEAGASRPATAITADLIGADEKLVRAWDELPDEIWANGRAGRMAGESWVRELPFLRWREVEIHEHDLGLAFSWRDWPDDYVALELGRAIAALGGRLVDDALALRATDSPDVWTVPEDACSVVEVRAPRRQLLAWLVGRHDEATYPRIRPWS